MIDFFQRAERILQRIDQLASISEDPGCLVRTYGTEAFLRGRDLVRQWMNEDGLQTRIDNIGNLRAVLPSENKNAKTFVIASHIDTVVNAGKFDGPLGVLLGLDIVGELVKLKSRLPFNLELIAFCDEEGC